MFNVTDAVREMLIGSIALIGPSGSGKTLSALMIAKGMMDQKYGDTITDAEKWQKIGFIDTEHKRAKIYANTSRFGIEIGSFKHLDFTAPFTVDRLDHAVKILKGQYKVEVIISDSITHFWEGDEGLLDLQQKMGGNFQAWRTVNPHYNAFVSLATGERHDIDMINCIRAKQEYQVSQNETGKLKVEKLGLKPQQRDSLEYEFQIVFSIDMSHVATTLKDNSGYFETMPQVITPTVGGMIYDWLKSGKDLAAEELEEKKNWIAAIEVYLDSNVPGMKEFTQKSIDQINSSKYGSLENMPLSRLKDFADMLKKKEPEISKEHSAALAGLYEVAKSFKIKGYTKMSKAELEQAIKDAQQKKGA